MESIGAERNHQMLAELLRAYSEPHRAYHNLNHLDQCFFVFDLVRQDFDHVHEAELALWFHDKVYDPTSSVNEQLSANQAVEFITSCELSTKVDELAVYTMIMATKHSGDDAVQGLYIKDAHLLNDVDLSILGQQPSVFDQYDDNIRLEYVHVCEEQYREGRKQVLQSFLERDSIYFHPYTNSLFDAHARDNLTRAIEQLG